MTFNSLSFFFFAIIVILLFRSLPFKFGKVVLVVASYLFYGAVIPWYCLLLFVSTITDFYVAQLIDKAESKLVKKRYLGLSLFINLGLLFVFKYYDFAASSINILFDGWTFLNLPLIDVVLPVGISFYTFQTLSYTIDVYRGEYKPTKDFLKFALYVSYFPQLVAGPVERAKNLMPQLERKQKVSFSKVNHGIERILWGLIKKVVVADRLAVFVNEVFANPESSSSIVILTGIIAFSMQLYLDFSGYCDIAIGLSRILGIKLTENFAWPFSASNPSIFWNKWNITLTHWFRDYFYKPIGGLQRKNLYRSILNIIFFFIVVGFWHGASWNFFFFGLYNGILVAIYQYWRIFKRQSFLNSRFWIILFSALYMFIGIHISGFLFRAPSFDTAFAMFEGISRLTFNFNSSQLPFMVLAIVAYLINFSRGFFMPKVRSGELTIPYYRPLTNLALLTFLLYSAFSFRSSFIYFQF